MRYGLTYHTQGLVREVGLVLVEKAMEVLMPCPALLRAMLPILRVWAQNYFSSALRWGS